MKNLLLMLFCLALPLSACGNKGKLRSPAEIEAREAKKAAKKNQADEPLENTEQDRLHE